MQEVYNVHGYNIYQSPAQLAKDMLFVAGSKIATKKEKKNLRDLASRHLHLD